ncbi:MAG: DUF814 domain-containing protein [Campylobacterales bacterium]|nr:DUF814 domain-containing protein [Campylobacterales bacterium]
MTYSELILLQKYLSQYTIIQKAKRIGENTILLRFDRGYEFGFMMTRGESTVYRSTQKPFLQNYNAPFDNALESLITHSEIRSIEIIANDRVLRFNLESKSSYKSKNIALQFEFTGRHTNVILLDENEQIIEALRHIDASKSFRIVRPGVTLLPLKQREQKETQNDHDIEKILDQNYRNLTQKKIDTTKQTLNTNIDKKLKKIEKHLYALPNEEALQEEAKRYALYGELVLAHLHMIKPYDKNLFTLDYDGNEMMIELPSDTPKNRMPDHFFMLSKKRKNRAKHIHIEKENLTAKISFLKKLKMMIEDAKDMESLSAFIPQKTTLKKTKNKNEEGEVFWIQNYKVLIGKNQNENKKLLSLAKANDIWMHIQGIPSAHVIIKTDKQSIPNEVLIQSAKLCVDFSTKNAGEYIVDYTKRKFVKPQEGSNVFYTNYESILITKAGAEIRS